MMYERLTSSTVRPAATSAFSSQISSHISDAYIHHRAIPAQSLSKIAGCRAQQRGNKMKTLKNEIYGQLARTNLLPESQSSELLADNVPPIEDIIMPLLIDRKSTRLNSSHRC